MANATPSAPRSFADVLQQPENSYGVQSIAPPTSAGITLAAHRAGAHGFVRGVTNDLLVVAQRNIAASSVRFDLGWGWREHACRAARPVYVVPADAPAQWWLDGESQCVYFAIDAAPLPALLGELGVPDPAEFLWTLAARGFDEAFVHELIERLWLQASGPDGCPPLLADSYRIAILHALARRTATLRTPRQAAGQPVLSRIQLREVLAFIDAHLAEPLTVEKIAAVAGVSLFHFSRLFRQATGRSPYAFVLERRIERAAERLRSSGEPVAQVAAALGFANASHFSRAFSRQMHCSPLRYRQQWCGSASGRREP